MIEKENQKKNACVFISVCIPRYREYIRCMAHLVVVRLACIWSLSSHGELCVYVCPN